MRDCSRCGGELSYTDDKSKLFGGVQAHLCVECLTEWGELLTGHELWKKVGENAARKNHFCSLAEAQTPVEEHQWQTLQSERLQLEAEAFRIGKEFVKALPDKEERKRQAIADRHRRIKQELDIDVPSLQPAAETTVE